MNNMPTWIYIHRSIRFDSADVSNDVLIYSKHTKRNHNKPRGINHHFLQIVNDDIIDVIIFQKDEIFENSHLSCTATKINYDHDSYQSSRKLDL